MRSVRPPRYLAAAALLLCLAGAALGQTSGPGARQVIAELLARYESLSSYQDAGVVRVVPADPRLVADSGVALWRDASRRDETLVSFKTFYARPGRFRFEWRNHLKGMKRDAAVWTDGRRAYSWTPSESPGGDSFHLFDGRLSLFMDEAEKSSSGAGFHVPSLLLRDAGDYTFATFLKFMEGPSLRREERVDGELCYVIKGLISETPWLLWVGKESRLLRKLRTVYFAGSFHDSLEGRRMRASVAEEVHQDIKVNQRIPVAVFRDRPPLRAGDVDLTR